MKYNYPKLISSKVHNDSRGNLQEIYKRKDFKNNFKFAILVSSKKNVFRGLHFQKKMQQEKIVVIVKGSIIDFCVDLRKKSKTFLKVFKFILKEAYQAGLYSPKNYQADPIVYCGVKVTNNPFYS